MNHVTNKSTQHNQPDHTNLKQTSVKTNTKTLPLSPADYNQTQ